MKCILLEKYLTGLALFSNGMKRINFTKMVASGNDFVIVGQRGQRAKIKHIKELAKKICDRRYGIGADGLLILENSKFAEIKMRIFNADGSEAKMCGNGARCVALYAGKRNIKIETGAGIIESQVNGMNVKIKLTNPKDIKLDIPIKISRRLLKVNFINTGVPHTVIFVEGLNKIDVPNLGRELRYHQAFSPYGANVDFVEVLRNNSLNVRTYERGVEDETLACGTGVVAAALLYAIRYTLYAIHKVNVHTRGGEILKVYFGMGKYKTLSQPLKLHKESPESRLWRDEVSCKHKNNKIFDVWLEGKVRITHKGEYYVK